MGALLFDMDGVLVNSVAMWTDARDAVLRDRLSIADFDASRLVGLNVRDEYDLVAAEHELDVSADEYAALVATYAEEIYGERVELLSGVERVFESAASNGVALGLVSASPRRRIDIVLERFDLDRHFDVAVGADEIDGPSKPAPDLYLAALAELGASPDETIAVEDSTHGLDAARRAGCYCVGYEHDLVQDASGADERYADASALCRRLRALCDAAEPPALAAKETPR